MAKRKLKKPSDLKQFIRKLGKAALYEMANRTFHDIEAKYESVLDKFYNTETFTPNVYDRTKSLYYGSSGYKGNRLGNNMGVGRFHHNVNIRDMSNLDMKKRPLNKKGVRAEGKMKLVVRVTMDESNIKGNPYKSIYGTKASSPALKDGVFKNFYKYGRHGYKIKNPNSHSSIEYIYDPTGGNMGITNVEPMRPTPQISMHSWWDKYKKKELVKMQGEAWEAALKRF